jgi:hypothetical protein
MGHVDDSNGLNELLKVARDADPGDRINYRDAIAAHGLAAIDAMTYWIADPRLGAFAVRVIERAGGREGLSDAALVALRAVDRRGLPAPLANDVDRSIGALTAASPRRPVSHRPPGIDGATGMPGRPGRGYWVMRTSPWEPAFVWSEARAGRLRQGWGSDEEQNLERIAEAVQRGQPLTEQQQFARRSLRMLTSWDGGMRVDDLIVTPNLPEYGRISVFRLAGSYRWAPASLHPHGERFGHVLPVEPMALDLDRHAPEVSHALRGILGVQTRLYNINGYGGDVELLIGNTLGGDRWGALWTEAEYELLFGRFPPEQERPSEADVRLLAAELGRTPDAVQWQWGDGASYVRGGSASTTSEPLKAWLERRRS